MSAKLGLGPMSFRINDALGKYSLRGDPIMIIASRNQVDYDSGYVMTTKQLAKQMKMYRGKNLMLCRDHCGPYFLDAEKNLSLDQAIAATEKTIAADIESGFDLIHIDTSRCDNQYSVAEHLLQFSLKLNPKIKFEFGTEENVGVTDSLDTYRKHVDFAANWPGMEFVVAQTGSLTYEAGQAGTFNLDLVKSLSEYAHSRGVKLKEHNADYLDSEQIKLRKVAGVDAVNIAPQLGVIQTKLILELADDLQIDTAKFKQTVLKSDKWRKWTNSSQDQVKVLVAGHYCFNSDEYLRLEEHLGLYVNVDKLLCEEIHKLARLYNDNLQ